MKLSIDQGHLVLDTIAALISRSPIVAPEPAKCAARLPAGFDDVDVAVLEWIAAEGRRFGRSLVRM